LAEARFSQRAEADLLEIAEYTLQRRGEKLTVRYLDELEARCQMLAENPALGSRSEDIRPGLRRMEYRIHVVFYRSEVGGILVSRILHERMLPEHQPMED
jgi:toxin ParE1/3/4